MPEAYWGSYSTDLIHFVHLTFAFLITAVLTQLIDFIEMCLYSVEHYWYLGIKLRIILYEGELERHNSTV